MALRKWMVGLTATLALGALGVAACGGDDNAGPNGEDAAVGDSGGTDSTQGGDTSTPQDSGVDAAAAQTAACQAVVDAYCSTVATCLQDYLSATCAQARAACPGSIFGQGSAMTVDQANACAAQIATVTTCSEVGIDFNSPLISYSTPPLRFFPACNVPGTRGPGDSCESNSQCASLFCASPESNFASALTAGGADGKCGTCAPLLGPNDDCTAAGSPYLGGPVCPIGEACDTDSKRCRSANPGDRCFGGWCAFGAGCEPNPDGGIGTCAAEQAAGGPCITGPLPCAGGGYCVFADDAHDDGGACAAVVPSGGKCTPSTRATPTCVAGTFCIDLDGGADHYCTALPGAGQPCLGTVCALSTAYCDQRVAGQPTCRSLAANGQPCGTFPQTFPDGGPTGGTASVACAGECSTACGSIPDSGPIGTCVGYQLGGQSGDSCGASFCTTCAPGANCVSGQCQTATLHCE